MRLSGWIVKKAGLAAGSGEPSLPVYEFLTGKRIPEHEKYYRNLEGLPLLAVPGKRIILPN